MELKLSRHLPICNMADQIPNFSLGFLFDPEVLYDLEDERENELLASINLEDTVNDKATYTLTESEVSNEVNYENNERGGNLKRQRFENMSSAAIDELITRAETKKTKQSTKWAIRVFEAWCSERKVAKNLYEMNNKELDLNLRYFYAEAPTKDGALYSRSSLLGLRNAIERYLNNLPFNRGISISKGTDFQASKKLLQGQIKLNKRENKENTKHKPAIPVVDLQKLKSSNAIRRDNPWDLLRNIWLHITLYWCLRGREGLRQLTKQSFHFLLDDNGREYVSMTHDEAIKNHPGGIEDISCVEKEARIYSTSEDPLFDGLNCLINYLQKLNSACEALFQYPKRAVKSEDEVWYDNKPVGVNKIEGMMKEISKLASLS